MPKVVRVAIAGVDTAQNGDLLSTVVGSCIAIMLYDKKTRIGGMAHIMLGYSDGKTDTPGKYADTAVPHLIQLMEQSGAQAYRLKGAKVAGGGEMFDHFSPELNVSKLNIKAVYDILARHGIKIIAEDLGGKTGRRVTLDTETGKVQVDVHGEQTKTL
ncbi:MAG: chemotaxis protein CheD [SAR324 cluster bacterium]|nr:chemotaxis protein CheD [SAR324 cluster bacterium]